MRTHRYGIGQPVRLKITMGMAPRTPVMFRVTARLPAKDSWPQYRIRSEDERHERVAMEDSLEAIEAPVTADSLFSFASQA